MKRLPILLAVGLTTGIARADMLDTSGMEPWEVCGLCHGLDGVSPMPRFPHLAGLRPDYVEKQFRDFRHRFRHNDGGQMETVTREIETEALSRIAAYFAEQPPPPPVGKKGTRFEQGKQLFLHGRAGLQACADCHGTSAGPSGIATPKLEAQHRDYLVKQLSDFADGTRRNDPGGVMQTVAAALKPAEREALADYLAATARSSRDFE